MRRTMPIDTHRLSRLELLALVTDAAVVCIDRWGKDEVVSGIIGPVKSFTSGELSISLRTPRAMAFDAQECFGVDIWTKDEKVFSSAWNSKVVKDYALISLKRGPWIPELLSLAAS